MAILPLAFLALYISGLSFIQGKAYDLSQDANIPRNYTGPLRPQVHFSPSWGFMNDPNGMFRDANRTWHLYYQYNPTDIVAGNQHWGHATSEDLYHWVNQPIAIAPGAEGEGIFSGSAVVDVNNTSGFFPDQTDGVVAIYTLNKAEAQVQDIAYSTDGGYTFTKYEGNPVLTHNSTQFRDPKVFWHSSTEKWVMVVAFAQDFVIGFYSSPNLKSWEFLSNFTHHGLLGLQYECPNLVELPVEGTSETAWILAISINPGAPLGGSVTQYFPGSFDGTTFTPFDNAMRLTDFAKDNYAGQWFNGIPGTEPQVSIAWASNWQYANYVPTGSREGWRSAMTVARVNTLANLSPSGYDLISKPYNLEPIMKDGLLAPLATKSNTGATSKHLLLHNDFGTYVPSGAIYFEVNITDIRLSAPSVSDNTNGNVTVILSSSHTRASLKLLQTVSAGQRTHPFAVSRRGVPGFGDDNMFFTDKFSAENLLGVSPAGENSTSLTVAGILDHSILELFLNGGQQSGTVTYYPEQGNLDVVDIVVDGLGGNVTVTAAVWALKSGWQAP